MEEKHSKVRWDKVLKNYRDGYSYEDAWEIAVIELVANAIDARAKTIKIKFEDLDDRINLFCEDDGEGMTKDEFEEYHNLGSLTKEKGGATIGFAGIGAKLTLDLCEKVYTETSKKGAGKVLASEWRFDHIDKEPKYRYIRANNMLKSSHGTYVAIYGLEVDNFSIERLKYILYNNYQYALESIEIYVNGKKLESPIKLLRKIAKKHDNIKSPRKSKISFVGEIFYLDDDGIQELQNFYKKICGDESLYKSWFDIVVHGKTILREEKFGLEKNVPLGEWRNITGYIRCDGLISAVKTSKDDINRRVGVWKKFYHQANNVIAKWLYEQGLYKEYDKTIKDESFRRKLREIEKELNTLLKSFPDILDNITSGGSPIKPKPEGTLPVEEETNIENLPVPDSEGIEEGFMELGGELGRGTHGGPGESNEPIVPHHGDDEKIEAPKDVAEGGEETKVRHRTFRTRRSRIGIAWERLDTKTTIEWIPAENLFIINENHPAAFLASQEESSKIFYTVHEVLRYIAENFVESKTDEEKINIFWELYERYLRILE